MNRVTIKLMITQEFQTSYKSSISEKITNYTLFFVSIVSVPLNIITFFAIQQSQCILVKTIPIFLTSIVLLVFLLKKRISTHLKSTLFIILFFSVGVYTLLLGLLDMASLWFILSVIFSFFSRINKLPVIVFISAFFLTLITGLLMIFKNPHLPLDYGFENCQFACVSIRIINFLIIGFLIFKILKLFFETIVLYIQEITHKNIVLEQLKAAEQKEAEQNLKHQILINDIEKQQLELKYKRKELTDAFSKILKFNKLLNSVKKDITNQNYKSAIINLSVGQSKNYGIEIFLIKFNEIYPDFQINLQQNYPHLSDTEIKVCCLIAAGLKSSEIGNLLNVATASVGKYRNRIRKKLNLEKNTDIGNYLFEKYNYHKINDIGKMSD